jgi:hypothetical protein
VKQLKNGKLKHADLFYVSSELTSISQVHTLTIEPHHPIFVLAPLSQNYLDSELEQFASFSQVVSSKVKHNS